MDEARQAIILAQCIIKEHHCTLWERENPDKVIVLTPVQRLYFAEAMQDLRRMLEEALTHE